MPISSSRRIVVSFASTLSIDPRLVLSVPLEHYFVNVSMTLIVSWLLNIDGIVGLTQTSIGWDAPCPGSVAAIQKEKGWEDSTGCFEWVAEDGVNGWGDPAAYLKWTTSPEKLFNTFYAMSRGWPNRVWPRITEGVVDEEVLDVPIEIQSHIEDSVAVRSACRCCYLRTDISY
jgi:hypothetical protein